MDPTKFAIQAVRQDERAKVGAKLRQLADYSVHGDLDLRAFIERHGLSSASLVGDVVRAVAAEVESWPMEVVDSPEEG